MPICFSKTDVVKRMLKSKGIKTVDLGTHASFKLVNLADLMYQNGGDVGSKTTCI